MKQFVKKGTWLDQVSPEIRWVYTLFLLFVLAGHLSAVLMGVVRVGPGAAAIASHYRGDATDEMAFPKEFSELLEVTHFHAYIEGIVLLVLAHLFVAVPLSRTTKMTIISAAFLSTFADLAAPWCIRYLSPAFAYLQVAAWIGMAISYLPLTFAPLYYLWRVPPVR